MKKLVVFFFASVSILSSLTSQIFKPYSPLLNTDSLSLRPLDTMILISDTASNIWQIATTSKFPFDSAYRVNLAITTDSINSYSNNLNSSFCIKLLDTNLPWGSSMISFYHRYETDSLIDGGIIEVSNTNGNDWINIKNDTISPFNNFIGLPTDTIRGGNYGYSGSSHGWKYAEFFWVWYLLVKGSGIDYPEVPMLRFRFQSDSVNTHKKGWMISNIVLRGYAAFGSVSKLKDEQVQVYPNPAKDIVHLIYAGKSMKNIKIEVFDDLGQLEMSKISDISNIDLTKFAKGVYILKISEFNKLIYCGKLVKN